MLRYSGHFYRFLIAAAVAAMFVAASATVVLAEPPPSQQSAPKGDEKTEQVKTAPAPSTEVVVESDAVSIESDIQTMEELSGEITRLSSVAKYVLAGWATPKSVELFHRILDDIEVRRGLIRDLGTVLRSPKFSKTKKQDARITKVLKETDSAAPIAETFQPKPSFESLFPRYGQDAQQQNIPEPTDYREELLKKMKPEQK